MSLMFKYFVQMSIANARKYKHTGKLTIYFSTHKLSINSKQMKPAILCCFININIMIVKYSHRIQLIENHKRIQHSV